jgi:hypothetical protein
VAIPALIDLDQGPAAIRLEVSAHVGARAFEDMSEAEPMTTTIIAKSPAGKVARSTNVARSTPVDAAVMKWCSR